MRVDIFNELMSLPSRPRLHGNGIIQWYVNSNQRLHVWPEGGSLAVPNHNALLHDHKFDMDSTILGGTLNHQIFHVDPSGEMTHDVIQFTPDDRKSAKGYVAYSGELQMLHAMNLRAGCQYWQKAGTFHGSSKLGYAVTLITKRAVNNERMARIICPRGIEPTDAFDPAHAPDESVLLEHVANAAISTPELENTLLNAIRRDK
jgi:hypothetical protein